MQPKDFINKYSAAAVAAYKATGCLASITLAQAIEESGWGEHAPGNNFFGEKAGHSWTGATQLLHTTECGLTGNAAKDNIHDEVLAVYPPGHPNHSPQCGQKKFSYRVNGRFKVFPSAEAAFKEHGLFIKNSTNFGHLIGVRDYKAFAHGLQDGGYATGADYSAKLIRHIQQHSLMNFDII